MDQYYLIHFHAQHDDKVMQVSRELVISFKSSDDVVIVSRCSILKPSWRYVKFSNDSRCSWRLDSKIYGPEKVKYTVLENIRSWWNIRSWRKIYGLGPKIYGPGGIYTVLSWKYTVISGKYTVQSWNYTVPFFRKNIDLKYTVFRA